MSEEELEEYVCKQVDEYEDRRLEYEEELRKKYVGKTIDGKKVIDVYVSVHNPSEDRLILKNGDAYWLRKIIETPDFGEDIEFRESVK